MKSIFYFYLQNILKYSYKVDIKHLS